MILACVEKNSIQRQLPSCNTPGSRTSAVKPRRVLTLNEQGAPAMDGKSVKVILFDLDNTLIETSRAGGVAMQKVINSSCSI